MVQQRLEDRALVGEVEVDAALGGAGRGGDVVDRGIAVARGCENTSSAASRMRWCRRWLRSCSPVITIHAAPPPKQTDASVCF